MATTYRTFDGQTVGMGDVVWAKNGLGPYIIGSGPGRMLRLRHVNDPDDVLHFEPGDLALYTCVSRPVN
ncbi:hypothetical protein ACFQ3B_16505 [Stackebrandtia endophytica]|uniref:hypothetical protein n=1 Tax=Stackebrandtia endophytica TaxID=1496996 RepID=UPI0014772F3B|nr:hypothetical protein [Stackebrandtia endophytica]